MVLPYTHVKFYSWVKKEPLAQKKSVALDDGTDSDCTEVFHQGEVENL